MYNTDIPTRAELPSTAKLLRSTLLAAIIASILLVTVVLPAEYAIDPTGAGRVLGLTQMGEIKTQLAEEAEQDRINTAAAEVQAPEAVAVPNITIVQQQAAPDLERESSVGATEESLTASQPEAQDTAESATEELAPESPSTDTWRDQERFTLAPGEGVEYKLTMNEGAVATFEWASDGGPINFDTHGDGGGNSVSYEQGRGVPADEGELEAAFTGNHGWFFRNRNDGEVTVTLRTRGDYGEFKLMP